jgi:hypothetical protein
MVRKMKIIIETPDSLVVSHRPTYLPIFCYACAGYLFFELSFHAESKTQIDLIGLAFAIICTTLFGHVCTIRNEFYFDSNTRQMYWVRRSNLAILQGSGQIAFADLEAVSVEQELDVDGRSTRVVLKTRYGLLPLVTHYSSLDAHAQLARQIRTWLWQHGVDVRRS